MIILLAGFLRLWRLRERGLLFWDDGVRMSEVIFLDDLMKFLRKNMRSILAREIKLKEPHFQSRGRFLLDGNPLNIIVYWLFSKGTKNIEFSGLVANAFMGIAGVIGTFFSAQLIFGNTMGVMAAVLIAVSGYHLYLTRSIHAEAGCGAFYVWGTYFYLLSLKIQEPLLIIPAGLCVGSAFASNSRQFYIPIFFALYEFFSLTFQPFSSVLLRMILLGVTMFLPLMLIEEFFVFLKVAGYPYPTYFMQIFERTGQRLSVDFKLPSFKVYWRTFYTLEGIIPIMLVLAGTWTLFQKFSFEGGILLSQCFFPLLFWSARPVKPLPVRKGSVGSYQPAVPRLASSSIYSFLILAAVGCASFGKWGYVILGFAVASGLWHSWKMIKVRSGYKDAIEFIRRQGSKSYVSFCHPISDFYENTPGEVIHFDDEELKSNENVREFFIKKGCRYLLYVETLHKNCFFSLSLPYLQKILETSPVYSVKLGYGQSYPFYLEDACVDPQILDPCLIQVFDLFAVFDCASPGKS